MNKKEKKLFDAVAKGDAAMVLNMIDKGININFINNERLIWHNLHNHSKTEFNPQYDDALHP